MQQEVFLTGLYLQMAPPLLPFMAISIVYCGVLYMVKLCWIYILSEWFLLFFNVPQNIVSCPGFLRWAPDNCSTGPLTFQSIYQWFDNRMCVNLRIAAPCYQLLIAVMLLVHYEKSLLIAFGCFQVIALFCRNRSFLGADLELGWKLFQLPYFWLIPVSTLTSRSCIDSSMQFNKILMNTK